MAIPAFGWLLLLQRWRRQSTDTFGIIVVAPRSKNKPAGILLVVLLVVAEKAGDTLANNDHHREGGAEQCLVRFLVSRGQDDHGGMPESCPSGSCQLPAKGTVAHRSTRRWRPPTAAAASKGILAIN